MELEAQLDELDGLGQLLSKGCVEGDGEVIQQRIADLRLVCFLGTWGRGGGGGGGLYVPPLVYHVILVPPLVYHVILVPPLLHHVILVPPLLYHVILVPPLVYHVILVPTLPNVIYSPLVPPSRSRWDALHSAAMERQSSLEESLLSLGEFEEAYEELWAWLNDALRQLEEEEPITGDPDAVATQLAKHKVCVCTYIYT